MRMFVRALAFALLLGCNLLHAGTVTYGTVDCLTTGCYGASDPTSGAILQGLAPNTVSSSSNSFGHGYPFTPTVGDFAGTDQIYVGSVQTGAHDGYAIQSQRINGPDVMVLDYSSLVSSGQTVTSLTLGIAADDFQFPEFGQAFTASINGSVDSALSSQLNSLDENGPQVHFFTIGLDPSLDTASHTVTLSIDEGGDGGDGWAVDFLTMGVTTQAVGTPEPTSLTSLASAFFGLGLLRLRRSK